MGKFQIICLLSVVTCVIISTVQSVPLSDASVQSENAAKCKKLCGFCGCTGYYCGDECLCECNSVTDGEAQCVDTMKSNCKKMELPFEVLIQGPNVNRMVRSLIYANPDEEVCVQSSESNKEKRSTISIYKPDEIQQKDEILAAPTVDGQEEAREEDTLIPVIVAQKFDTEIYPVKIESTVRDTQTEAILENVENRAADSELNQHTDSLNIPSLDTLDRTNTKRHIIDVNQEISELENSQLDDSFLYKRDAADETVAAPAPEENVASPQDEAVASPPPSKLVPGPLLPKLRAAWDAIPTPDEISKAWEAFRYDVNVKISNAQQIAQQKAADLRAKTNSSPLPPKPAFSSKFNPAAFRAAVPLLPNKNDWKNKNDWTTKNDWKNNKNGWNNNWLSHPWVGQAPDESVGSPQADVAGEESVGAAAPEAPAEEVQP